MNEFGCFRAGVIVSRPPCFSEISSSKRANSFAVVIRIRTLLGLSCMPFWPGRDSYDTGTPGRMSLYVSVLKEASQNWRPPVIFVRSLKVYYLDACVGAPFHHGEKEI